MSPFLHVMFLLGSSCAEREQALAEVQKEDADIEDDLADSVNSILKKSLGKEVKFKGRSADQSLAGEGCCRCLHFGAGLLVHK